MAVARGLLRGRGKYEDPVVSGLQADVGDGCGCIRAAAAAGVTPNSDQLRAGARTADQLRASARTADPNRQLTPASQNSTPSIRTPLSEKIRSPKSEDPKSEVRTFTRFFDDIIDSVLHEIIVARRCTIDS